MGRGGGEVCETWIEMRLAGMFARFLSVTEVPADQPAWIKMCHNRNENHVCL